MNAIAGYTGTLVVGIALGAGAMVLTRGEAAPGLGGAAPDVHAECRHTEEALRERLDALEARAGTAPLAPGADPGSGPASVTVTEPGTDTETGTGTQTGTDGPGAATEPQTPEQIAKDARKAKRKEIKAQLKAVRDAEPGSPEVLALVAQWRAEVAGDDPMLAELSGRALHYLARMDKLRPEDIQQLATDFARLEAGTAGRPGVAGAVTRGWARDPRLAGWLADLPAAAEPDVRESAIWALDEHPSQPYRDWVVRLAAGEPVADVLDSVWDEDIVVVSLTRSTAPQLVAATESRVAQGDLPTRTRARAYRALGLSGMHAPAEARASLERLLANETDAGVRAFGQDIVAAIEREESNLQALEGLWDKHRDQFGE